MSAILENKSVPLISVLMPTYNPDLGFLKLAIASVLSQTYSHWELCIADDASTDDSIRGVLETYRQQDARIKVTYRISNGHISEASNSALELVTGEWVALMDQDDTLAPNALQEVADAIHSNPESRLIYSDEDKIDESGKCYDPYFKTSWNKDLFYSHNLICHLGVYKKKDLDKIHGFRRGFEGAQDHDLALRVIETIGDEQIHHIPQVLYHWRAHSRSTASDLEAKPYAVTAGERAINDHLQRIESSGNCIHDGEGGYRIRYPIPEAKLAVTAIIFSKGNLKALRKTIDQIKKVNVDASLEILVCPQTARIGNKLKGCSLEEGIAVIQREEGKSLSSLLNPVAKNSGGDFLWFLSDSLEGINDGLEELLSHAARPSIGAVGGILLYPGGRVRQAGLLLDANRISYPAFHHFPSDGRGYMGRLTLIQNYSAVSLDCMVIEKKKFLEVGGFDEKHLAYHHLDVDLCLRLKSEGYRTLWTPYAKFTDSSPRFTLNKSMDKFSDICRKDTEWMKSRWGHLLSNDPAYNPNLNQKKKDFSFKWPLKEE